MQWDGIQMEAAKLSGRAAIPLVLFALWSTTAIQESAAPVAAGVPTVPKEEAARVPVESVASSLDEGELRKLASLIGSAPIVALGEGTHLAREPLDLRNRLFRYLVERKGFTAIAIESGLLESRSVDAYVQGGSETLGQALAGIGWTFDRLPQNRELLLWMRQYNQNPLHHRKLHFYGFDIAGSPGNTQTRERPRIALKAALDYLRRADPVAGHAFNHRLSPWLPDLTYGFSCRRGSRNYSSLTQKQRVQLTLGISDLMEWMKQHEAVYIRATSPSDYAWGFRAAVAAQQLDRWFRALPAADKGCANPFAILVGTDAIRDRVQAENIRWILSREGPRARILVFAHTLHLSRVPIERCWGSGPVTSDSTANCASWTDAGVYLSRWYRGDLSVIASIVARGSIGCGTGLERVDPPVSGSLPGVLGHLFSQVSILDVRNVPGGAAALAVSRSFGSPEKWKGAWDEFSLPARSAFDVLVYFPVVRPACPP